MTRPVLPGKTLGIFGGGQLGRMLAQSARQHGYRVRVFSDAADSPAGALADDEVVAAFGDANAALDFARGCDVLTLEFENLDADSVERAAEIVPVRPSASLLRTAQHRLREKAAAMRAGFAVTPHHAVTSVESLDATDIGFPAILKTATDGYDGKGQRKVGSVEDAKRAYEELGAGEQVLEGFVDFVRELSVVVARGSDGEMADFGVFENQHRHHVLDVSISPARIGSEVEKRARAVAHGLASELELVGVMCVELFETASGELLFNEIAPRPHNTGHLSIEAFATSQFEQQLRAVCGLPLGSNERRAPAAAMANLLGDLWSYDESGALVSAPNWAAALALPGVHLHLYGKSEPKPGRKMGHLTALASSPDEALARVLAARDAL